MKTFFVRAVVPAALTIALFVAALFFVVIPLFERSIMDQKREMIRELTTAAWNILARCANEESRGRLDRAAAQQAAIAQIRALTYGHELKDYFWVSDTHPRMVVHPYRTDLEGRDLSDFTDPAGKKLFVEFVRVTARDGAGFVDYQWQWKDDARRIEPKISYVKLFPQWGWIIGTGVYLNDVRDEIAALRRKLVGVSLAILAVIAALLAGNLAAHYRAEAKRRLAEAALRASEEKYRLLVESAEGSILMAFADEPLYANRSMLRLLGYDAAGLVKLRAADIIVPTEAERRAGLARHEALLLGRAVPLTAAAQLRQRDGTLRHVILSLSIIEMQGRRGFIAVATDMTDQRENILRQDEAIAELQAAQAFLNRRADEVCSPLPPVCEPSASVAGLLADMDESGREAALLPGAGAQPALVTRAELGEFAARGTAPATPVRALKLPPLATVPGADLLCEAYAVYVHNDFRPLGVRDGAGALVGLLTARDLLQLQQYAPAVLLRALADAATPEEMISASRKLPALAGAMMAGGVKIQRVNRLVTGVADAVVAAAVRFAVAQLGPPPARFAFVVMGSEGRHEQTLRTDQDNAIIFADVPAEQEAAVQEYFLQLGTLVCDWNAQSGYANCKGEVMARNPKWCGPLRRWRQYFSDWVNTLEAMDLMQSKIFFDFRAAYGEAELAAALRAELCRLLPRAPRFFTLLARNVLRLEPPLGRFGNFVLDRSADGRATFDIKLAMTPIVDFARLYALQHNLPATNTLERLDGLRAQGVLLAASHEEITHAYRELMRLRLEHQVRSIRANRAPDNLVAPADLTAIDRKMLAETFAQIKYFQARLSQDFLGTMFGA